MFSWRYQVLDDVFRIKLTEVSAALQNTRLLQELRPLEYKTCAIVARDASLHNKN